MSDYGRSTPYAGVTSSERGMPLLDRIWQFLETETAWRLTTVTLFAILLVPFLVTEIPPLLDYPNHLARLYILAEGESDPVLSKIYAPDWELIPNLAIDLIVPPLLHVLPLHVAGRLVAALSLVLPVAGIIVYARTISNSRSYWPLASGLVAYNATFLLGFMNFQIGMGLAFLAGAIWHRGRNSHLVATAALTAVLAVAIFFCHLIAIVFLGLLIFATEITDVRLEGLRHKLIAIVCIFVPALFLYFFSDLADVEAGATWLSLAAKVNLLLRPFLNYSTVLDVSAAVATLAILYIVLRNGYATRPAAASVALIITAILFVLVPIQFKGGSHVDLRLVSFGAFLLFAMIVPKQIPKNFGLAAGALIAGTFLLRMVSLTLAWNGHNIDIAELRQTIESVTRGSRVLVVTAGRDTPREYFDSKAERARIVSGLPLLDQHMAAMLVTEHKAFWPFLFANRAQQPVIVLPPYREIAALGEFGLPQDYRLLTQLSPEIAEVLPYLVGWQERFDYVLVLDAGGIPNLKEFLPDQLDLLHMTDMAALFHIRK